MTSLPNGVTLDVSSDTDGGQGDEQSEMSDSNEKDSASSHSETTLDLQRAIIEDIRFVLISLPFFIITTSIEVLVLFQQIWIIQSAVLLCLISFSNRKTEFGIGVELTAEGQKLMQVHQDRLGRSLERLSTELYSKDTHFVLELIQVALNLLPFIFQMFIIFSNSKLKTCKV